MKQKPLLIIILGPTASGKSELAIKLAKKFSAEIVSADSRQIYKGMDIGTAKPLQNQKSKIKNQKYLVKGIPHHLIDIVYPNQEFNVAIYKKLALRVIKDIQKREKLPILVGGTGLYIKAMVDNLEIPEVKPDWKLRKKLEGEIKTQGLNKLYQKLIKIDPESAYIVDPKNPRRVIRALEVALKTKKPFSQQRKKGDPLFDVLEIGVVLPEEKLKEKIEKRVDKMIKTGLVREVKDLIKIYDKNLPTFDAIGYREIINYLDGKISLGGATEEIKKNTWRYAKRQITWFKRDPAPSRSSGRYGTSKKIHWVENYKESEKLVKKFLENKYG